MNKHTPGPWHLGEVRHANITPHGNDGIIRNDEHDPVAIVNFAGYSKRTAFANAHLIAAAPETAAERDRLRELNSSLLAMLKEVRKHLLWAESTDAFLYAKVVRVIDKAEGETE